MTSYWTALEIAPGFTETLNNLGILHMRLGAFDCTLQAGTLSHRAYGTETISERHRHRFELNNEYREQLREKGLVMAGTNPKLDLVEIIEIPDHPWFVGVQFHPEFKSKPIRPHPLFRGFVGAALKRSGAAPRSAARSEQEHSS